MPRSTRGFPAAEAVPLVSDPVPAAPLALASTTSDPSLSPGLDPTTFADVWGDWASNLELESQSEPLAVKDEDDCPMEFLDLSYLNDAPLALVC